MKLDLYQRVALLQDIPEHHLKKGDVGMLVDYVPHPANGEDGYVLEIFNALGESIAVLAVPQSLVAPLQSNEVLSVRVFNEDAA
jgi:hypothetical protein